MPTVSVVVPVLNAARTLPACLDALARLDPAPGEIILVDNGSSDGSLSQLQEFARRHQIGVVRALQESRRGAAAARNTGIRTAGGELVAFTDADCSPEQDWLASLVAPFADPVVGAVAGSVGSSPVASILETFSGLYTLRMPGEPSRHRRWTPWSGGFPTANFMARRALLERLAGFDEALVIYGEDYDLCARLYGLGVEIAYTPVARVTHHHRTTLRGMLRQAFGFGRAHPYLLRRHAADGLWLEIPGFFRHWSGFPIHGWVDLAAADKKILMLLCAGLAFPPALWLLPLYALWLARLTHRQAGRAGTQVSPGVALQLAGLLVAKSAAMTAGRWYGSVKYGALCL